MFFISKFYTQDYFQIKDFKKIIIVLRGKKTNEKPVRKQRYTFWTKKITMRYG